LVLIVSLFGHGCISSDPEKFDVQVRHWVPLGTSVTEAKRIMKHHGFECYDVKKENRFNADGVDALDCTKEEGSFHNWSARFLLRSDRVSGYGPAVVE
jgi:hypothetical protein